MLIQTIGLPPAKLKKAPFTHDQVLEKYVAMKPEARAEEAQKDLVILGEHGKSIRASRAEAHQKAKRGLFTMIGGLGITTATGITTAVAKDLLPAPLRLGLQIAGAAVTGVGITSMFMNLHVRDFSGLEAQLENSSQQKFLRPLTHSN